MAASRSAEVSASRSKYRQGARQQLVQLQVRCREYTVQAVLAMREVRVGADYGESNEVRVAIRDSGPGASPETLPLLFEPFYTTKAG